MNSLLIKNVDVITPDVLLENCGVFCEDGRIQRIVTDGNSDDSGADIVIEAKGMMLAPGYIEMHMHRACSV